MCALLLLVQGDPVQGSWLDISPPPDREGHGRTNGAPVHVVSATLRYFKDDVVTHLSSARGVPVHASDITWLITVPDIYDDFAKQFMRHLAHDAGITAKLDSPSLRPCLEPKAACLAATVKDHPLTSRREGKAIMIIGSGGGAVDITMHRAESTAPLRVAEALPPDGDVWGSTLVDAAFKDWLKSFLGDSLFEAIKDIHTSRSHGRLGTPKRHSVVKRRIGCGSTWCKLWLLRGLAQPLLREVGLLPTRPTA